MSGTAGGSASGAATLAHRSVAGIKSPTGAGASGPSSPHTPSRNIASTFGSPSSLRAEEEVLILEIGTRKLQVGFAGDATPRGCVWFGPDVLKRVGDFSVWTPGYQDDWRVRSNGRQWGREHELWQLDRRGQDMGLVGDKVERALREAITKYLLIDSRPRRLALVVPSALPIPLLSAILDTLFNRFQPPAVSLLSEPVMTAAAAGVRSALVIDLGWTETVVTSIYEYREVHCNRSIRGGRMLVEQTHQQLAKLLAQARGKVYEEDSPEKTPEYVMSFEECEEITSRIVWCKQMEGSKPAQQPEGLPTVHEQDETEEPSNTSTPKPKRVTIPFRTTSTPTQLDVPFEQLAVPCENTFFASQYAHSSFDDHELPLVALIYRHLLHLPVDVRALCMSRIIFTGGCANVLGLRGRLFDEIAKLVRERGFDPVQGKGADQARANPKLKHRRGPTRPASDGPVGVESSSPTAAAPASTTTTNTATTGSGPDPDPSDGVWHDAANAGPERDPIDEQLKKGAPDPRRHMHGRLRSVESLGAWSGASLVAHLKIPAVATIDRELWLAQGAAGAGRAGEVDFKAQQRQSMGPGGLLRGAGAGANWTLGAWGAV